MKKETGRAGKMARKLLVRRAGTVTGSSVRACCVCVCLLQVLERTLAGLLLAQVSFAPSKQD